MIFKTQFQSPPLSIPFCYTGPWPAKSVFSATHHAVIREDLTFPDVEASTKRSKPCPNFTSLLIQRLSNHPSRTFFIPRMPPLFSTNTVSILTNTHSSFIPRDPTAKRLALPLTPYRTSPLLYPSNPTSSLSAQSRPPSIPQSIHLHWSYPETPCLHTFLPDLVCQGAQGRCGDCAFDVGVARMSDVGR